MRACVLEPGMTTQPRARVVSDRAMPVPGPGEALIQPVMAAVSDIDLELASGRTTVPGFAGVLGNQGVGVVAEVNIPPGAPASVEAKRGLKGKRVVAAGFVVCGACPLCRGGLSAHCRSRVYVGAGRDGWLAEAVVLPLASVYAVPERVETESAALVHEVASAAHAAQVLRVEGKPYITVLGDGALGLLTAQVMSKMNASVRVLGRHAERLALCDRWGIKHRHVDEVGRRGDQDVVVECTGTGEGLGLALRLVRPRGKVILKGTRTRLPIALDGAGAAGGGGGAAGAVPGLDLSPVVVNEIEVLGCREGSVEAALSMLGRGEVTTAGLMTKRYKLEQAAAALAAAEAGELRVAVERG